MKLFSFTLLAFTSSAVAFSSNRSSTRASVSLNANNEISRKAFVGASVASIFAGIPGIAEAGTMAQENVNDPTEQWETGAPTAEAKKARVARYTNARTQLTSNFAPQKRLTLERKSPVTRLDINAPNFEAYKRTFPGLYKKP
mmetsp:Transcript_3046/g.4287  ORF Transcript_3046/g.4287 Transcript_3046/m.4287 type:complete len:142 (-) Transcript_3046:314-739(-)